jgi:hypothetical protein
VAIFEYGVTSRTDRTLPEEENMTKWIYGAIYMVMGGFSEDQQDAGQMYDPGPTLTNIMSNTLRAFEPGPDGWILVLLASDRPFV